VSTLPDGPRFAEYRERVRRLPLDRHGRLRCPLPFGHGLSYTSFAWSGAAADRAVLTTDHPAVTVVVTVANTGERAGTDVVQVYVRPPQSGAFRPAHHLGGFAKVALAAGESADVQVVLDRRAFARWSPSRHDWWWPRHLRAGVAAPPATSGPRSRCRCRATPCEQVRRRLHRAARHQQFDRASFEALLGRGLEPNGRAQGRVREHALSQLGTSTAATRLRGLIADRMGGVIGEDEVARVMVRHTLEDASLRMLSMFGQGKVSPAVAEAVLLVANGRAADAVRALRAQSAKKS
jgi:beta-glucosidase